LFRQCGREATAPFARHGRSPHLFQVFVIL
jgi:hypothetical protein